MEWEGPGKQGLYDPQNEHEACGVGFVVAIDGKRSHKVTHLANDINKYSTIRLLTNICIKSSLLMLKPS